MPAMTAELLTRALHFMAQMVLYGTLLSAHLMTRKELPRRTVRTIAILDLAFALAAGLVLATGLVLWFGVGKPAAFYTENGLFHIKLTLFVVAAGLSIRPTMFWIGQRRGDPDETVAVPGMIKGLQGMQLLLLLAIPLLAVVVARGG